MFQSKIPVMMLTKKLIVELASRDGWPNAESPSPYKGFLSLAFKRFSGHDFDGSFLSLLNQQKDFDADEKCPQEGVFDPATYLEETRPNEYNPSKGKSPYYLRRLEDIDSSWIGHYLDNVIWACVMNDASSIKEFNKKHQSARSMIDDEDVLTTEGELLVEYQGDYSPYEIAKAKEKIPYLLRRLHDHSKELRVHLISLIIANEKAKRQINITNRRDSTKKKIKVAPRHLLSNRVYKMNANGTIGPVFADDANSKEDRFKEARDWILNYGNYKDAYYQDMIDLLHYYDIMGIDITREDPDVYQEDYISKLTVLYITNNRDYVLRKRRGFHKEVFEILKRLPLEEIENTTVVEEIDEDTLIDNTMNIYNDSVFLPSEEKNRLAYLNYREREEFDKTMYMFVAWYNIVYKTAIDINSAISKDGFFFVDNETPLVLDISAIINEDKEDSSFIDLTEKALLNENGYLVRLAQGHFTMYLDVSRATEYLQSYFNNKTDVRYSREVFGKWMEVSI